jgi:hypothetical protein
MPEAAVKINRDPTPCKDDVGTGPHGRDRPEVDPIAIAQSMKLPSHSKL